MRKNYRTREFIEARKEGFIRTTGLLVAATPILAVSENVMSGMTDSDSALNRVGSSVLFYLGFGKVYTGGRSKINEFIGLDRNSRFRKLVDFVWGTGFSAVYTAGLSTVTSGSLEEFFPGMVPGAIVGGFIGIPCGVGEDVYSDLGRLEEPKLLPSLITNSSRRTRNTLMAGLVGASVLLTSFIYSATPEGFRGLLNYGGQETGYVVEDLG